MVRWLSPKTLVLTALDVLISGLFGRYADKREIEALSSDACRYPVATTEDEVWIDYVADTGDGWRSSRTVAWALQRGWAAGRVRSWPTDVPPRDLPRGRALIMGGDQVYPKAGLKEYNRRLRWPYEDAAPPESADEQVFAIPGNHDWYDGLTQFLRLFCRGTSFASWETEQRRSYFAIQLPHRWWLLGIDVAFDHYLDEGQLAYFDQQRCEVEDPSSCPEDQACPKLHRGDAVILCVAKPHWEIGAVSGDFRAKKQVLGRAALAEFERRLTGYGLRLRLVLSGDLHHYARFAAADGEPQRITSGGGGAFLYPTHRVPRCLSWPSVTSIAGARPSPEGAAPDVIYEREGLYPETATSRSWWLAIPFAPVVLNLSFAVTAGVVYLLLALLGRASLAPPVMHSYVPPDLARLFLPGTARPSFVVFALLLLLALVAFADGKRWWLGSLALAAPHWLAHIWAASAVASWSKSVACDRLGSCPESVSDMVSSTDQLWFALTTAALILVVGGCVGGLIMGIYLLLAQVLGRHPTEAYSALHVSRYKHFLRIRVAKEKLVIFPIGVEGSRRRWRRDGEPTKPLQPRLIDDVVEITRGPARVDRGCPG